MRIRSLRRLLPSLVLSVAAIVASGYFEGGTLYDPGRFVDTSTVYYVRAKDGVVTNYESRQRKHPPPTWWLIWED